MLFSCALFDAARAQLDADALPLLSRLGEVTAGEQLQVARVTVANFTRAHIDVFPSANAEHVDNRLLVELLISKAWFAALRRFRKHNCERGDDKLDEGTLLWLLFCDACTYNSANLLAWVLGRFTSRKPTGHVSQAMCHAMVTACERGPKLFGANLRSLPEFARDYRYTMGTDSNIAKGVCADVLVVLLETVSLDDPQLLASVCRVASLIGDRWQKQCHTGDYVCTREELRRVVWAVCRCVERVRADLPYTKQDVAALHEPPNASLFALYGWAPEVQPPAYFLVHGKLVT